MKIIEPSFKILDDINKMEILEKLELCGRVCYKSEYLISDNSAETFILKIIESGHESVIEHEKITVKFVCDRGISHEIVRHRIASYSQESTRYCNYSKNMFDKELTFIKPFFWKIDSEMYSIWLEQMQSSEKCYIKLLDNGATPEQARTILPNSLKTELIVTMNLREWRHFFKLRTSKKAHPQMKELCVPLLIKMYDLLPVLFDDILKDAEINIIP